jgi:hypothetical protein
MDIKLFSVIDEQASVGFTGKLNILSNFNHQYLGHVLFLEGRIHSAALPPYSGLKALFHICLQEASLQSLHFIIEPEVVSAEDAQVFPPPGELEKLLRSGVKEHFRTVKHRPPENIVIQVAPNFIASGEDITPNEFELLCTLTEWSRPFDIYQHCPLLDHEITAALVHLRQKSALKILARKDNL